MAEFIKIEVEGLRELIADFDGIERRADNLRPVALGTRLLLQADVDQRFAGAPGTESGGTVWGGANWPPLTEAYLSANPRRRGGQLLRDTGELLQSFTANGQGHVFEASKDEIVFGSALPKASGLDKKRPMLFMHDELANQIAAYWREYIVAGRT